MEERIIECVRNKELLYNIKLKDYKNALKKTEAWEQIATELGITATECKTKWNLLRNAFIHAISRRKTVTGQGVKNFKKWKFEEEMGFLLPFMANRNTIATPVGEFSLESTESSGADIIEESLNTSSTQPKKRHLDNYHEDMLNLMKARSQRRSEKNDIDLFFDSIAETVKKFPKLEQVRLKFNIMKMVHEIEMRMCSENDGASNSTSSHSYSPSPHSFDTHYSLSPPVIQQASPPQFIPQSSPSPQIAYSPASPVTQQASPPQFIPHPSSSPQIAYSLASPVTQQASPPQFIPQSSPSPQITYSPAPPVNQQGSPPQFIPQSSPSPQIAYSPAPPVTQQVSSSQFESLSPQMAYYTDDRCYTPQNIQPATSQISRTFFTSDTQNGVVEISIPDLNSQQSSKKTSARGQGVHIGPAHIPQNIQPSTSQISRSLLTSKTQKGVVKISIPKLNLQQSSKKTSHTAPTVLKEFLIIKKRNKY